MNTHTPTPWFTSHYRATEKFQSIETHTAVCLEDGRLIATLGPSPDNQSEADAAFIVRSTNNFDAMREVIMALGHWMMGGYSPKADSLFNGSDQTWKEKVLEVIERMEK